ncbi:MAG: DUF4185 domain-containing protein [Clostridia bacterium]|nr:DUF4185 domain-containing protein [Clostridia bacterium]
MKAKRSLLKRALSLALALLMLAPAMLLSSCTQPDDPTTDPVTDPVTEPPVEQYVPLTQDVVFVSATGTGTKDGTSAENSATLQEALGLTKKNGGTIVVCAPISLDLFIDKKYYFPSNEKPVTITSVYDGVDYRATANASISLENSAFFYGDYIFEGVKFICAGADSRLHFQWNNITLGDDIVCARKSGVSNDIALVCGINVPNSYISDTYEASCHEDAEIIVKSGSWAYIRGGNRRIRTESPFGTIDEGVSVIIRIMGGKFTSTGTTDTNSAVGMNSVDGELYMEISGGEFAAPVYVLGRVGSKLAEYDPSIKGKVTLNITGGTFNKNTLAVIQSASSAHSIDKNASVILAISGGNFPNNKLSVSGASNAACKLYTADTLTATVSIPRKFGGTATADEVKAPTLLYNKTVYTAPPVYDKEIVVGPDIFDITTEDEAKLTDEAKKKLKLVRELAKIDGKMDALQALRTLRDKDNKYNLDKVVSARLVTLLTGEYSINKSITNYGMGGSGGGYMIDCGDFMLFSFGDIELEGELGGPWRSNALAFSTDFDYTDGIVFDGFYLNDSGEHDGIASEILHSEHNKGVEMSKIPTGAFKIGDTLYMGFMSVRIWDDDESEGKGAKWQCNYGSFAKSTDMGRSWETPSDLRWPEESGRIQPFPVLDGDMVYVFTVPAGRNGAVQLMRVHKDDFENFAAYEYMVGRDENGNAIYERGYDAMMSDYYIVDKYCGGVEVMWNDYLEEWIMVYATPESGNIRKASIVMRVAKTLDGEWSDPVVVMSQTTYGPVYEPRICERYSSEGGKKIMIICSRWNVYNSLIFEVELQRKDASAE